jgi:hypothetical protein
MFNGIIYFTLTPNGYVVDDMLESFRFEWRWNHIERVWPAIKCVKIEGQFNFIPKRGQFCKRPHKLIDFDNSYERKDK